MPKCDWTGKKTKKDIMKVTGKLYRAETIISIDCSADLPSNVYELEDSIFK